MGDLTGHVAMAANKFGIQHQATANAKAVVHKRNISLAGGAAGAKLSEQQCNWPPLQAERQIQVPRQDFGNWNVVPADGVRVDQRAAVRIGLSSNNDAAAQYAGRTDIAAGNEGFDPLAY